MGETTQHELAEQLARELGIDRPGQWRLELTYRDGQLLHWYRHEERIPASALHRPLTHNPPREI